MALKEITYEEYRRKLAQTEEFYRDPRQSFPAGAREKGLRLCEKFRREVEELGPENCRFFLDTQYDLVLYRPKEKT